MVVAPIVTGQLEEEPGGLRQGPNPPAGLLCEFQSKLAYLIFEAGISPANNAPSRIEKDACCP
jgi:hypothetical protein